MHSFFDLSVKGFGQHHDFINRVIFMTVVYSVYYICHMWVVGFCI